MFTKILTAQTCHKFGTMISVAGPWWCIFGKDAVRFAGRSVVLCVRHVRVRLFNKLISSMGSLGSTWVEVPNLSRKIILTLPS